MRIRALRAYFIRMAGLFNRKKLERQLAEELESHLQMHAEDNLKSGMTPEEAQRQALIKLGGVEQTKEEYRSQRGLPLIETLIQDVRYGFRRLIKSPGVTIIALLSLALGIGANTAIFSLVNTALLRPLPVENPDELVSLSNTSDNRIFPTFSYPNYKDLRDRNDVFAGLFAYRFAPLSVSRDGVNERLWGYIVSGNYFEVLGVEAFMGRMLSTEDDKLNGAHPVTVLSYECWRRFGSDPGVVGKSLIVNGRSFTIIGVAPKGFFGTEIVAAPEFWFPMAMQAEIEVGDNWLDMRGVENIFVQGRLKPGVSVAQAQAALTSIALQLETEHPNFNEGKKVSLGPVGYMSGSMRGAVLGFTGILMGVVTFVLLLACTNLVNLLLAQAVERRKEIAVRLALGASRGRLVRQLMTESMLLAIMSGALGLLLAYWLVGLAVRLKPPVDVPLSVDLHLDYRVLAFTCLASIVTGALFGLLPAFQATKVDVQPALKGETAGSTSRRSLLKNGLIVLQVSLSLVLLVAGGLMLRALQRAQTLDLGFDPKNAVEASFDLRLQGYDKARALEFHKRLLERMRHLPGVQSVGLVDLPPVDLHFSRGSIFLEGQSVERARAPLAMNSRVSPGYFQAIGTPLIRGRDFNERDDEKSPPVAIINETFARRFWPGEDPLGKRFRLGRGEETTLQVIGVVADGKYAGLNESPQPYVCRPLAQAYSGAITLIVRSDTDPHKQLAAVRSELQQLDPYLPLSSSKLLEERLAMPLLPVRVAAAVLSSFGLLALALAAIGIYGVMSYAVSRRTREIGVRVALGAQSSDILRLILWQGMVPPLVGVAIGILAALGLTQLIRSLLFGVSSADPLTYAGVVAMLSFVAALACYIPARRAAMVDPMVALRDE